MTGKYPARLGITDWIGAPQKPTAYREYLPLEEVTIAEALKEAGYATGYVRQMAPGRAARRTDASTTRTGRASTSTSAATASGMPPSYFSPYKGNPTLETMPPGGKEGEYLTDRLTDEVGQVPRSQVEDQAVPSLPCASTAVHIPLQAKQDLIAKYEAKAKRSRALKGPHAQPARGAIRRRRQSRTMRSTPAMMQSDGQASGRSWTHSTGLGIGRDTVVILHVRQRWPVHGAARDPTCNLPLRAGKGWLYEGGIREPMIDQVARRDQARQHVAHAPVTSTDFYPTMLEMAGLPLRPGQHVDGVSLARLLRARDAGPQGDLLALPALWQREPSGGAVRAGDWKLIEWYEDGKVELYNLKDDLGERHDLAATLPEKATELRQTLHAWRAEVAQDARGLASRGL